jgi:transposase-like protein
MGEIRRTYDPEFREGAVRIVRETGKSIAEVARDLGLNPGTLGNWVKKDQVERGEVEGLTGDELSYAIITWIEHTYNRRRRQRALGKLTPVEFELAFASQEELAA